MTAPIRAIYALVAVALTLGAVLLGQGLGATPAEPDRLTVTTGASTRVCPALTSGGSGGTVVIDGRAAESGSEIRLQRGDGTDLGVVPGGQIRGIGVDESATTLARAGVGAADRSGQSAVARIATGPQRGLSLTPCADPGTDGWFVGLRSTDRDRATVLLTNPDRSPAEVSLAVHTSQGVQSVAGASGLTLQPGQTRAVGLEPLLTSPDPLAVQVRATAGRVAAVATIESGTGAEPAGADWTIPAAEPATSVIIPGVPGGDGSRELSVVNPSDVRTTVRVEAIGAQGAFAPADADTIELGPQSVGRVALESALSGEAVAIRLTADQPVTGAVVSRSSTDTARADLAVAPAAAPVTGLGIAAVAGYAEHRGTLVATAPGAAAGYAWEVFDGEGTSVASGRETVAAGATAAIELPAGEQLSLQVVPDPGAELYAGVVLAGDWENIATLSDAAVISPEGVAGPVPRFDPRVG
ncbi:DUF5719 family protein [Naumannella huperziae]